jgi:metal-responsive CopG/Arc/MetJ family transcriptional regulator
MSIPKKAKVSVTIASDLLAEIDAFAERSGIGNRSHVIELWLRRASREQRADRLAEETVAYYTGLTDKEAREDAEWAAASGDELARLDID